jgi:hypothetical protein
MRHRLRDLLLHLGTTIGVGLLVVARASALTWPVPTRPDVATTPANYRASESR